MGFARGVAFEILNAGWQCIANTINAPPNWFIKKHDIRDKYEC